MFWNLFWPIALITLANCFYNICTKSTPEQANPFLSLCVTYLTAAAVCISVFLFSQSREAVSLELSKLNWTAPTLGLAVVALEVGYILTYRAGWKINTASLVTNIALAILLLFIGFLFYGDADYRKEITRCCHLRYRFVFPDQITAPDLQDQKCIAKI